MRPQAFVVADLGVRSHLGAAACFCPTFSTFYKGAADAETAVFGFDEPALQITDPVGMAIFDERANARF